jgi:AcrR family transcriptional regulator
MRDTPLGQALREPRPTSKKTPMDAFELASRWFLAGRRIDMVQLATEVGVSRATLYRWVGSREALLAEVIWSATGAELENIRGRLTSSGLDAIRTALEAALTMIRNAEALRKFVAEDPEYALRLLTTRQSVVQNGLVNWCTQLVADHLRVREDTDVADLSYAIVRVAEGFAWSDMITGEEPSPQRAIKIIDMLIAGAAL